MIFRKKSHFSMKMPFKMAAKAAPLFCREAALINRGEAAPLKTAPPSAKHSAPQAGTNLFLRPKAALFSFPGGRAPSPHSLFGGEAAPCSAAKRPNLFMRPKAALFTPSKRGAFGPTISFLKKETVPPGGTREKSSGPGSRSSSPKLKCAPTPHKVLREAPSPSYVGVQGARPLLPVGTNPRTPWRFSLGPLQRPVLFSREKRMGGWKAPLLEGMRSAAFGRKDGLSRARGAECLALGSAFERSAPSGRKDRLGRAARGKKPPRRRKPAGRFSTFSKEIVEKSFTSLTGDT